MKSSHCPMTVTFRSEETINKHIRSGERTVCIRVRLGSRLEAIQATALDRRHAGLPPGDTEELIITFTDRQRKMEGGKIKAWLQITACQRGSSTSSFC